MAFGKQGGLPNANGVWHIRTWHWHTAQSIRDRSRKKHPCQMKWAAPFPLTYRHILASLFSSAFYGVFEHFCRTVFGLGAAFQSLQWVVKILSEDFCAVFCAVHFGMLVQYGSFWKLGTRSGLMCIISISSPHQVCNLKRTR